MMWKVLVPLLAAVFAVGSANMLVGGLVGGFSDIDANDQDAQNALQFAVVKHNQGSNDMYLSQVAEVVKVQRQVVAGFKYMITVRMAKTPCRKGVAIEVCDIHQDQQAAQPYLCTFTVWSRPWMNNIELLKQTC
ncbi:cystatin C (amyloid angiopathy and cerebral hemorrhage) [Anoplopoma fimbria]|uniref:cystatin C (amyloid angiopathy and cerebral hemorrhage) n=1 Tax=Anoplopoma fimbria TaxID=229290 RepID=UPI0023ECDC3D|nr:cystatin C (amyloid angiopathy and cerebral hemorrhage) [Anoplopoma fimbria]